MGIRCLAITVVIGIIMSFILCPAVSFAGKTSSDILREGLLGAGAGAAGSAIGGGNAGTGALVGAGVNIVGGALLDSIAGKDEPDYPPQRGGYGYPDQRGAYPAQSYPAPQQGGSAYSDGYEDGYANGYKKGYTEGYKEGLKEGLK